MFRLIKKVFYKFIPSAHVSAYIRLLYLRLFLKEFDFQKALDAGCGPGLFSFYVAERHPKSRIIGYDISSVDIDICNREKIKRKLNNVYFKRMDLTKVCESKNYDFIFSIDVIEHIFPNLKVFSNIYNALEPGGIFYLAMPYEPGHCHLLPRRYFKKYTSWAQKEHIGEQYNLRAISILLTQIGFNVIDARHTFGFWGKLAREFDMLTENHLTLKHLLQPLMFIWGYLDTLWRNGSGSYAIRVIAEK